MLDGDRRLYAAVDRFSGAIMSGMFDRPAQVDDLLAETCHETGRLRVEAFVHCSEHGVFPVRASGKDDCGACLELVEAQSDIEEIRSRRQDRLEELDELACAAEDAIANLRAEIRRSR